MVVGVVTPTCITGLPFLYAAGVGALAGISDALSLYLSKKTQTELEKAPEQGKLKIVASSGSLASTAEGDESDQDIFDDLWAQALGMKKTHNGVYFVSIDTAPLQNDYDIKTYDGFGTCSPL